MGLVVHRRDDTALPVALGEITAEIFAEIDRMALRVGELLHRAKSEYPERYEAWVEAELPFGLDKARRLRMIFLAYRELPAETLARLPRAWQSLYAITRLPSSALDSAIESGAIHPDLTVRQANEIVNDLNGKATRQFSQADLLVGRLCGLDPSGLSPDVADLLAAWLGRR